MSSKSLSFWAQALLLAACAADSEPASTETSEPERTLAEPERTVAPVRRDLTTTNPPEAIASGSLQVIVPPDELGRLPADLWIGCKYGPEFQVRDLEQIVPLADGPRGVSDAIEPFLSSGEGQYWPQENWLILRQTEDEVLLVHEGAVGLSFMQVTRAAGGWRWSSAQGAGECPLHYVVPAGLHTVDWRLDPAGPPPDATATTLEVLVHEQECVSGQTVDNRLLGPQVVMTTDAVRIAFAAEPPPGDVFNCPSNPESAVRVELPAPLDERAIIEGLAIGTLSRTIALEDYLVGP